MYQGLGTRLLPGGVSLLHGKRFSLVFVLLKKMTCKISPLLNLAAGTHANFWCGLYQVCCSNINASVRSCMHACMSPMKVPVLSDVLVALHTYTQGCRQQLKSGANISIAHTDLP